MQDLALFRDSDEQLPWRPLAERRRPQTISDICGQEKLCGEQGILTRAFESGTIVSMIFWGPPGCGKTTLGRLMAQNSKMDFQFFSASTDGLKDLRRIVAEAKEVQALGKKATLLFCDEIHRLNKGQQDAFLPHVESGLLTLVGATTENPSFEVNAALLSRCQVIVLEPLSAEHLLEIMNKALKEDALLKSSGLKLSKDSLELLAHMAEGDARQALLFLEALVPHVSEDLDEKRILEIVHRAPRHDKNGEAHYNLISCLHKSVRASHVQASVYYCVRLLESGEDPKFVCRRLMRMAVEDIGLADPQALQQAAACQSAVEFLGSPESHLALVQLSIYLASAPKSNTAYLAEKAAQDLFERTGQLPPPKSLLNAPTNLMKDLGYGKGYVYDHNADNSFSGQDCLPEEISDALLYEPGDFGFEKEIKKRLQWWQSLKAKEREE
jgi:putative ATPase